ncbi:lysophospholipid acyltransferase family protein [Pseudalkalibacillus sp. Hm43]|uniref:lysophospholipid acyltransferase family protein n=1 Tax=Pseudalkalibacillus sp. Hm43 TaxID=3450742 RepID=UPI003F4270D4
MIEADKRHLFQTVFHKYNRDYLLKRHFHTVSVKGTPDQFQNSPIVYMMNHSSWWDGLIVYHSIKTLSGQDHYMMMDEKQMKEYRFFRKIGAYSIDKTNKRGILQSLRYSIELLEHNKCVWIFPQGDIYHLETRPLAFQSGIAYLLKKMPSTTVIPVTLYYSFGVHQKPDVTMTYGEHVRLDWNEYTKKEITFELQKILESQLNEHKELVVSGRWYDEDTKGLIQPGRSTSDRFDSFQKEVKRWLPFSQS